MAARRHAVGERRFRDDHPSRHRVADLHQGDRPGRGGTPGHHRRRSEACSTCARHDLDCWMTSRREPAGRQLTHLRSGGFMRHLLVLVAAALLLPVDAFAQTAPAAEQSRVSVDGGVGFGTTWDDEGLLGRGAGVSAGFGFRLNRRVTIRAFVDRVAYYRDVEWLTFDGRIIFGGAEA